MQMPKDLPDHRNEPLLFNLWLPQKHNEEKQIAQEHREGSDSLAKSCWEVLIDVASLSL